MQPREYPFQFMMEIDRLAADLRRLADRSVTELTKCVIIVAGLSAGYGIEIHMLLKNNPTGLEKDEIERVVGNQYNRLLRHQQTQGFTDIEMYHHNGSWREEEETAQPTRG